MPNLYEKKLEYLVDSFLAEHITDEYPEFVDLIRTYFKYMDENYYSLIINILKNNDFTNMYSSGVNGDTGDMLYGFYSQYFAEILPPEIIEVNKDVERLFVRLSKLINNYKGCRSSFQYLLKYLADASIVSDGEIEVLEDINITLDESSAFLNISEWIYNVTFETLSAAVTIDAGALWFSGTFSGNISNTINALDTINWTGKLNSEDIVSLTAGDVVTFYNSSETFTDAATISTFALYQADGPEGRYDDPFTYIYNLSTPVGINTVQDVFDRIHPAGFLYNLGLILTAPTVPTITAVVDKICIKYALFNGFRYDAQYLYGGSSSTTSTFSYLGTVYTVTVDEKTLQEMDAFIGVDFVDTCTPKPDIVTATPYEDSFELNNAWIEFSVFSGFQYNAQKLYDTIDYEEIAPKVQNITYDFSGTFSNIGGMRVNDSRREFYLTDLTNNVFGRYSYTNNFSDSVLLDTFDFSGNTTFSHAIGHNNDGTKFYIIGNYDTTIYAYDLSIAWDTSSSSLSATLDISSLGSQWTTAIDFNLDGTKMYILRPTPKEIREYDLGSAYDITSASLTSASLNMSATVFAAGNLRSMSFEDDGTKLFISDSLNRRLVRYNLSTGYSLSTAEYIETYNAYGIIPGATIFTLPFGWINNGSSLILINHLSNIGTQCIVPNQYTLTGTSTTISYQPFISYNYYKTND